METLLITIITTYNTIIRFPTGSYKSTYVPISRYLMKTDNFISFNLPTSMC